MLGRIGMVVNRPIPPAFVDDYTRWTVSSPAEAHTTTLQRKVIPKALEWAAQSGAAFEADKASFIHFTRNQRQ
jgi:hypothetical protein